MIIYNRFALHNPATNRGQSAQATDMRNLSQRTEDGLARVGLLVFLLEPEAQRTLEGALGLAVELGPHVAGDLDLLGAPVGPVGPVGHVALGGPAALDLFDLCVGQLGDHELERPLGVAGVVAVGDQLDGLVAAPGPVPGRLRVPGFVALGSVWGAVLPDAALC